MQKKILKSVAKSLLSEIVEKDPSKNLYMVKYSGTWYDAIRFGDMFDFLVGALESKTNA